MSVPTTQTPSAASSAQPSTPVALLRLPQVLQRVPVSRSHWWAGIAAGKFPAGIKLSDRVTCWRSTDIDRLIETI